MKDTFSSQAYQVRLISVFLLLPRLHRLLFLLRLAIVNLQPPFAQEQSESVRSGHSEQSFPPLSCCAPTQQSIPPLSCCVLIQQSIPPSSCCVPHPAPSCTCTSTISPPGQELQGCQCTSWYMHGDSKGEKIQPQNKVSNQIFTPLVIQKQPYVYTMYHDLGKKNELNPF